MQEYWESYMKPIESKAAMVSFNAQVADNVPDIEYIYVGFVKLKLQHPKEDGLIDVNERDDISFIEDRLEMESLRWRSGKYIGRIISAGEVTFIYYLKLDFEWSNTVESAMKDFSSYEYEFGSRMDLEWEVYTKLLFPTVYEWQIISNHHACDNLQEQGDTLKEKRAIEHKSFFYSAKDRDMFTKSIESDGFNIQENMQRVYNSKDIFGVKFYKIDSPHYYSIDEITLSLINTSQKHNGEYDGWECSLVK